MIKAPNKQGKEETSLSSKKVIYETPTAGIRLNDIKLQNFPLRLRTR